MPTTPGSEAVEPQGDAADVETHVEAFVRACDSGAAVELDAFCADVRPEIRAEVRRRCDEFLKLDPFLGRTARRIAPGATTAAGEPLGRYRLLSELGAGGMGVVYRALDPENAREVAVKVIHRHLVESLAVRERFRREVAAAARVRHPSVVPVLDSSNGEPPYLVMELIHGESLDARLSRARKAGAPLPRTHDELAAATLLVADVAAGLGAVHAAGIVHRDIKPHNILLDASGRARLTDFGLAKSESDSQLTRTGDLTGTPHYMSPEQLLASRVAVDRRTDIYSLGVVLYEMLAGCRPFEGTSSKEVIFAISFRAPRPVRELNPAVPPALENICLRAIKKEPDQRYSTAAEFERDLRAFVAGGRVVAKAPLLGYGVSLRLARRFGPHRKRWIAAAAIVVLAGIGTIATHLRQRAELVSFHVESDLVGDEVLAAPVELVEDRPAPLVKIGVTPFDGRLGAAGRWRIVVRRAGFGFAELTRDLFTAGSSDKISVTIREDREVERGMIRIPGGVVNVGLAAGPIYHDYANAPRTVDAFWIDRTEVSNGDFRAFLVAHPTSAPPRCWNPVVDPEWERLPVLGLSIDEMTAYATWVGKRLPTWVEWQIAARGPEMLPYPWGVDGSRLVDRAVVGRDPRDGLVIQAASRDQRPTGWDACASARLCLRAVDSPLDDRSPFGLLHVLGNAAERTSSLLVRSDDDLPRLEERSWIVGGCDWTRVADRFVSLDVLRTTDDRKPEGADERTPIGFRCARADLND